MKTLKQNLSAILAAFIWGSAFIAQEMCSGYLGAFSITALRSIVAVIVLAVMVTILNKTGKSTVKAKNKSYNKRLIKGGVLCGIALTAATILQQSGIAQSGAGKSAFITAMYVVIVPILGLFIKKRAAANVWVSVFICIIGFYFLCLYGQGSLGISGGDFLVFLCAVIFAVHILIIENFSDVDSIELSCVQFFVVAVVSTIFMFLFENINISSVISCILPILYLGIFSSGIAYTLQMVALKDSNPTVITLLLSLESVFAILCERFIFRTNVNPMYWWEIFGCILIFSAVIFSQISFESKKMHLKRRRALGRNWFWLVLFS